MPASGRFFFRSTKTLPTAPARRHVPAAAGCTRPSTPASPGAAMISPKQYGRRLSFCCDRDGCRKRVTPPSVRFLGRKVYLGAVVILVAAMRQGPSPRRVRELSQLFGADRQTIARWQVFWQEHFPQTRFWKVARGRLVPAVAIDILPLSLLDAFLGRGRSLPGLGPAAAVSLADHDHRGPGDRGFPLIPTRPAEDTPRRSRRTRVSMGCDSRFHPFSFFEET